MQIDNSAIHAATRHADHENQTKKNPARTGSHLPPGTRPATSPYAAQPIPSPAGNQTHPGPEPAHPRTPDGRFAPAFEPNHSEVRTHSRATDAKVD